MKDYEDKTLMAYADGELDEAQRAEIARAIELDPALARRVEQHRALRAEIAGAFSGVLGKPVPERLVRAARQDATAGDGEPVSRRGTVVPFPGRSSRAPTAGWRLREWSAMAASVALGALISWKLLAPEAALIAPRDGGLVAGGALATALDRQLASAQSGNEPVLIGLSFRAQEGYYCRSYSLPRVSTAGLACHVRGEWQIVTTAGAAESTGVRPAASPPPAVMQAIEARIHGEALDAADEESARNAGWNSNGGQR